MEQFARNATDYFKALNIKPEPVVFIKTAEDFEALKDYKSQMQWLALAETLQPKSIMVLMTYAEAVAKSGDKEKGKELYGKAKKIAEERGIKELIDSIDEKIARL